MMVNWGKGSSVFQCPYRRGQKTSSFLIRTVLNCLYKAKCTCNSIKTAHIWQYHLHLVTEAFKQWKSTWMLRLMSSGYFLCFMLLFVISYYCPVFPKQRNMLSWVFDDQRFSVNILCIKWQWQKQQQCKTYFCQKHAVLSICQCLVKSF